MRFLGVLIAGGVVVTILTAWGAVALYFNGSGAYGIWKPEPGWSAGIVEDGNHASSTGHASHGDTWFWTYLRKPSAYWFGGLVHESAVYYVPENALFPAGTPNALPGMVHSFVREHGDSVQSVPRLYRKFTRLEHIRDSGPFEEFLRLYEQSSWYLNPLHRQSSIEAFRRLYEENSLVPNQHLIHYVLEYGFPFPALAVDYSKFPGPGEQTIQANNGIPIGTRVLVSPRSIFAYDHINAYVEPALPTKVLWPGFLANTAINAIALCGIWLVGKAGVGRIRRRRGLRRLWRGECPDCRYDIGDGGSCPECGWTAPVAT